MMDNTDKKVVQKKLDVLEDEVVVQVLFDILHKRRNKYSLADNSGQQSDYQDMVKELKEDYQKQIK